MKRKRIRVTLTNQIKSRGLLDHAIQSLGLKLPDPGFYIGTTGATGCFTSSHSWWCPLSRVTGTMTRYWLKANPQATRGLASLLQGLGACSTVQKKARRSTS